jgi:hypothetical protein
LARRRGVGKSGQSIELREYPRNVWPRLELNVIPDYSSSVDACLALIAEILPDWHWHIGHGPDEILPYAALRNQIGLDDDTQISITASAPTLPLALLHAAVKAIIASKRRSEFARLLFHRASLGGCRLSQRMLSPYGRGGDQMAAI